MSAGKQPSRALLIAAGLLTQLIGALCFILGLASIPVVHDLKGGMSGVIASVIASLAAIVCGTLVWRGRLVPLALAAGLDVGFGIGLPRGGSAVGAMLRMLPANEASTAETLVNITNGSLAAGGVNLSASSYLQGDARKTELGEDARMARDLLKQLKNQAETPAAVWVQK